MITFSGRRASRLPIRHIRIVLPARGDLLQPSHTATQGVLSINRVAQYSHFDTSSTAPDLCVCGGLYVGGILGLIISTMLRGFDKWFCPLHPTHRTKAGL
jgi:hypothetical protein